MTAAALRPLKKNGFQQDGIPDVFLSDTQAVSLAGTRCKPKSEQGTPHRRRTPGPQKRLCAAERRNIRDADPCRKRDSGSFRNRTAPESARRSARARHPKRHATGKDTSPERMPTPNPSPGQSPPDAREQHCPRKASCTRPQPRKTPGQDESALLAGRIPVGTPRRGPLPARSESPDRTVHGRICLPPPVRRPRCRFRKQGSMRTRLPGYRRLAAGSAPIQPLFSPAAARCAPASRVFPWAFCPPLRRTGPFFRHPDEGVRVWPAPQDGALPTAPCSAHCAVPFAAQRNGERRHCPGIPQAGWHAGPAVPRRFWPREWGSRRDPCPHKTWPWPPCRGWE